MPTPLNFNVSRALDENGNPLPGAKAYFYQTGTTTPITVYSDEAETTPHATPVVADSEGVFPTVYYSAAQCKVTVTDASGAVLTGYPLEAAGSFGSIATQDADDVAVTGGTINNTPIGGTTAAAGAFTTLAATGLATLAGGVTASGTLTGIVGRFLAVQTFTASGTYTPTTGAKFAIIKAVGATGAGGGADTDVTGVSGDGGTGGGAAGGGSVIVKADVSAPGYSGTVVIGAKGTGVSQAAGGNGGTTTYDDGTNSFSIPGSAGGAAIIDDVTTSYALGGEGAAPSVTGFEQVILAVAGEDGHPGLTIPNISISTSGLSIGGTSGGSALFGGGRMGGMNQGATASVAGKAARWPGEGGSGAAARGTVAPVAGGNGFDGLIIIEEYSL